MDQNHVRLTKKALRQKFRELTIDPELCADFLNMALLKIKPEKLLVLMEFTRNS
jgi:hypothetical protein